MAPSTTVRRLLRETLELSASSSKPNPSFHAHPVSDEDLFEWHFTMLGPPSPSPYAGGLYHGRISLPLTYPLKPPNFRFLTPSGRFEVNREICLSISGFHEESWMPAWGIRTALVALRTFMGEQEAAGQVGGMEASKSVRQTMAKSSRQWRCEGCVGKTNEEIMREWWDVCAKKGIKVEQEAGLEELPEGLRLEFKDQMGTGQKLGVVEEGTTSDIADAIQPTADRDIPVTTAEAAPVAIEGMSSKLKPGKLENSPGDLRDPLPEIHTEASSSTAIGPSTDHKPISTQPISPLSSEARRTTNRSGAAPSATQDAAVATPFLDKAISGLVIALLFMVLKKVVYDPNVFAYDY